MLIRTIVSLWLTVAFVFVSSRGQATAEPPARAPLKVIILAGQSNMEGHGVIKGRPGQKGTLETLSQEPATAARYRHLLDKEGEWIVRDDVWLSYGMGKAMVELLGGPKAPAKPTGPATQQ